MSRCKVLLGDCLELIGDIIAGEEAQGKRVVVVTDPPYNIGYKYRTYKDRISEEAFYEMLAKVTSTTPSVLVMYPEALHRLSIKKGQAPERVCSWVYNSNTARQHRDVAFYGVLPDFRKVGQPYKNPGDKRIAERIRNGKTARLYDWWNVNQVKNVSADKTAHPCQMPVEVMKNIVGTLPGGGSSSRPILRERYYWRSLCETRLRVHRNRVRRGVFRYCLCEGRRGRTRI